MHNEERRRHRSHRSTEALHLFLDAARARLGLRALTLGTADGGLIAGSGASLERIAEIGACVGPMADVATWRTRVGDRELVLTAWGRAMSADLADGVRRILG